MFFFFGTKCEQEKQRNELTSLKQTVTVNRVSALKFLTGASQDCKLVDDNNMMILTYANRSALLS